MSYYTIFLLKGGGIIQKIENQNELSKVIIKYDINKIFSKDMRPYMELMTFKKNEYVIRETDDIKYLIFQLKGKAKVFTTLSNGKSLLLCFYEGFMVLGELEIISCKKAMNNVQVLEDTYCIGISAENVRRYLLNDAIFLKYICESLGGKLYQCSRNSSINLLYSLENRLASYILTTGENKEIGEYTELIFNENLTEIAELLGTSYRHLLRTLKELCSKGVLKKIQNYYQVMDKAELSRISAELF